MRAQARPWHCVPPARRAAVRPAAGRVPPTQRITIPEGIRAPTKEALSMRRRATLLLALVMLLAAA